ncbi:HDOD domain-containing protein [Ectothiorhodospiraceae bacterium BW-2]|nr:HDOD domain-containing protein [Ectothiorhodospiraceae bacterium BW-2]
MMPMLTVDKEVQRLVATIRRDFEANRLRIPSLPDIALRVRQAIEQENHSARHIAEIIQFDPAIAARVIQLANSVLFRGSRKIENTLEAVARIGLNTVRDLTISLSMQQVMESSNEQITLKMRQLWQHSVYVAAISRVLGRIGPELEPDRALLAGLLHDIGAIPVLIYAESSPELIYQPSLLEQLIEKLRGRLGVMLLRRWEFADSIAIIPMEVDRWQRNPRAMPDYADVVLLANIFANFGRSKRYSGPPLHTLPAFNKFPLGALGAEGGVEILEEAKDEIKAVLRVLGGSSL